MAGPHVDPLARRIAAAISGRRSDEELYFNRVRFVKRVILSSVSPGPPVAEQVEHQLALLDRCLNEAPGGRILGREILSGTFRAIRQVAEDPNGLPAEAELVHTRTEILHVGFERKPFWMEGKNG